MNDIRIVTIADSKYFHYLKAMVNSIAKNLPGVKIHAFLVNMSDDNGKMLQMIHPDLEYTIELVKFKFNLQRKCYCTNRRAYLIHKLREETDDILVWMDADSLVVKKSPEFLDFARKCDVSFRPKNESDLTASAKRKKSKPRGFMAGIIIIGNSKNGEEFVNMYDQLLPQSSYLKARLNYSGHVSGLPKMLMKIWMSNQDLLDKLHKDLKDKMNFVPLPQKYLDCSFEEDTVIWSIKASTRKDKKFNKQFKKYRISTEELEKDLK